MSLPTRYKTGEKTKVSAHTDSAGVFNCNFLKGGIPHLTVKTQPRFGEFYPCFGHETKTKVVRILVIFRDRPMFSHIIQKVSARAFD